MTEAPELKPCPFCGGEAEYRVRNDENIWDHSQVRWVHVHCGNMDCDNYGFDWPEEAEPNSVERWNTRADLHTEAIEAAEQRGYARGIEASAKTIRRRAVSSHDGGDWVEELRQTHDEIEALSPTPQAPVTVQEAGFAALVEAAKVEAEKAMRKFPQPNYVISKVAEEAGEVVKAAIHCAEGREAPAEVRGEMIQLIAMLYRLWVEGDEVHGLRALAEQEGE